MPYHKDNCPHCNANLNGDPIPEHMIESFGSGFWRREIGIEYPEKYDGIWEWKCPDCKKTWPAEIQKLKQDGSKPRWPY